MLVLNSKKIKSSISMVEAIECVANGFLDFDDGEKWSALCFLVKIFAG